MKKLLLALLLVAGAYWVFSLGSINSSGGILRGAQLYSLIEVHHALAAYQKDHGGELPERLSLLVPDYIPAGKVRVFFNRYDSDFRERCQRALSDPAEIDKKPGMELLRISDGWILQTAEVGYKTESQSVRVSAIDQSGKIENSAKRRNGGTLKEAPVTDSL